MTTVVISAPRVADHPNIGGHFWEYMQYAHAFRRIGCDVWWLERVSPQGDPAHRVDQPLDLRIRTFIENVRPLGFADRVILYTVDAAGWEPLTTTRSRALDVARGTDLLVNFDYWIDPAVVALFPRTALFDIDPGLLQFWIHHGQLRLADHDVYFTTGETVGTPAARFPDGSLPWRWIRPGVALDLWPDASGVESTTFTTVSSWWADEWITDGNEVYENNKRVTFLDYWDLPCRTGRKMELALYLGPGDEEDVAKLRAGGWTVRHSVDVASRPDAYRSYIAASRAEFSCVKPSCLRFNNAWISNRTLCYLASGKPAVVQDTGPSSVLPRAEGLFRFSSFDEAVAAVDEVEANYRRHARAARELAAAYFDATAVATDVLESALSPGALQAHR
jgi:hypothetical protein